MFKKTTVSKGSIYTGRVHNRVGDNLPRKDRQLYKDNENEDHKHTRCVGLEHLVSFLGILGSNRDIFSLLHYTQCLMQVTDRQHPK